MNSIEMFDLKNILTDFTDLIQHIALLIDDIELFNDAKNLYNKILETLND